MTEQAGNCLLRNFMAREAVGFCVNEKKEGTMRTISRDELRQRLDESQNFTLVNVLSEESFEDEHIPGSHNIPYDDDNTEFAGKVEALAGSKDEFIVTYCASVDCPASANAAKALEEEGFTDVRAYEGGMKEWKEASYPVEGEKSGPAKTRGR